MQIEHPSRAYSHPETQWSRKFSLLLLLVIPLKIVKPTNAFHANANNLPKQHHPKTISFLKSINSDPNQIRGDKYGTSNNSTIPTPHEVATVIGVKPSLEASKQTWKRAWKLHKRALPLLHLPERLRPKHDRIVDSSLNLACLWWKALAGNDASSLANDDGFSFDLLPKGTRYIVHRWIVKLGIYPRLHHANVELRTVFLDSSVQQMIDLRLQQDISTAANIQFRLISMGAGYDIRSVKLSTKGIIQEAYEIDLPEVVKAKLILFERLKKRRPSVTEKNLPHLIGVDLNQVEDLRQALLSILKGTNSQTNENDTDNIVWHNIFLFEGVMIYLKEGIPSQLLETCSNVMNEISNLENSASYCNDPCASLCLADRMENVPGGDEILGTQELKNNGWDLVTWLPKPGLARHMCSAALSTSSES